MKKSMQTPRYEYSQSRLAATIATLQSVPFPHGLTIRYAVKANPFPAIIQQMHEAGLHFDASSSYEASELLALGIPGSHISLSSQQTPHNLPELLAAGVKFVATSLHQLEYYLATTGRPNSVAVRINPPVGHGHNNRTNTGGVTSSFGIWHEYIPRVLAQATAAGVRIERVHMHVGSGADPSVWSSVMDTALEILKQFPDATILDIGGGYKVHRYGEEKEADMPAILTMFRTTLDTFVQETGREIALEIEPGTYLVAHAGTLVATVDDIVDTSEAGYQFLRLNTGMNDFLRSSLYGARHQIEVMNEENERVSYVVVGHNCESGDILTPAAGDPETIEQRELRKASIGNEVRIYDMGAYCASMRARGYNSFPIAPEYMVE
jgi:diaminopimelate decarboxylase